MLSTFQSILNCFLSILRLLLLRLTLSHLKASQSFYLLSYPHFDCLCGKAWTLLWNRPSICPQLLISKSLELSLYQGAWVTLVLMWFMLEAVDYKYGLNPPREARDLKSNIWLVNHVHDHSDIKITKDLVSILGWRYSHAYCHVCLLGKVSFVHDSAGKGKWKLHALNFCGHTVNFFPWLIVICMLLLWWILTITVSSVFCVS